MAIRITRNSEGNCINFVGSSNPAYWNSCLSAVINADDADRFDVVNDVRSANGETTEYEFYAVRYQDFADKDGNSFNSVQEAVDYINENANVVGVSDVGADLTGVAVNFRLDETNTSIIMDNGAAFGVNTIKAVADVDGTIHIHAIGAGSPDGGDEPNAHKHFEKLEAGNVSVNGVLVSGGLNDVVNTLNELFTVGAFEAVVISDPYSTMVADVGGEAAGFTLEGSTAIDPAGDDIFTNSGSGNYAGLKSTATINQAGEYFTFDIRGEGQLGFGLVHAQASYDGGFFIGNSSYANPATFAVTNSAHYGFQFSHWFHPTPNGSWTNYGASTGFVRGGAWTNWDKKQDWLDGTPVKMKVGIDENGFIAIYSKGDEAAEWLLHARSSYPVPEGAEFHLGIKIASNSARVATAPMVHLLEEAAPVMNFRYIESPDGNYDHPIFATAEEANYYDLQNGGTGTSSTATYPDDPTATTWYVPTNGFSDDQSAPPVGGTFEGTAINWTEVTSLTNADLAPAAFSGENISREEGTAVNIPINPVDVTWSTTVDVSPAGSGLVYSPVTQMLQGTLADVGADTVYTVTVTRANAYGSSVGTFTITATDVAPVQTNLTPWTKALDFSGSSERAQMTSSNTSNQPIAQSSAITVLGLGNGSTVSSSSGRPWAIACVFQIDGNSSNQHIWNQGDGAGSTDDNIYLRLDSSRRLYFGWGRSGSINELLVGVNLSTSQWYGAYIGFDGTRLSGANATAANLAAAFDVHLFSSGTNWQTASAAQASTEAMWSHANSSVGGRMDRAVTGPFTIGGRGSNRNFHGKVASCVVTTLKLNVAMPDMTEIEMMVTDPQQWVQDYKVGETYRRPYQGTNSTNFQIGNTSGLHYPANATQVWLMGDGSNDSYSNMIRNQINKADQNYTKLNLISMVSNDIQTANIPGLT